jgi:hypothetical protein
MISSYTFLQFLSLLKTLCIFNECFVFLYVCVQVPVPMQKDSDTSVFDFQAGTQWKSLADYQGFELLLTRESEAMGPGGALGKQSAEMNKDWLLVQALFSFQHVLKVLHRDWRTSHNLRVASDRVSN